MIKIAIIGPWWNTLEEANNKYFPLSSGCKGEWENIKAVENIEDVDYYIILQGDSALSRNLPPEKKIYFQREPKETDKNLITGNKGLYFSTYKNSYHYAAWWVEKNYDELINLSYTPKSRFISTVMSHKTQTYGQKLRVDFVKYLYHDDKNLMDIYGSVKQRIHNPAPRGFEKVSINKFDCMEPYKYSFAAENASIPNYFSEKLIDCYLAWSMPVYWGCNNLEKYFPKESFCRIDISKPKESMEFIKELARKELTKVQLEAIQYSRELILNKYNFWPTVSMIINEEIPKLNWLRRKINTNSSIKC